MQLAEHRALLSLMGLHAPQDVVERSHGIEDIGAFVQHDALRALAHRGISDFCPGRDAVFGEAFEHLRRPDDRHVRGFGHPQDFFLHFGEALVAALDGEVAAGDHHTR